MIFVCYQEIDEAISTYFRTMAGSTLLQRMLIAMTVIDTDCITPTYLWGAHQDVIMWTWTLGVI